MRVPSTDSWIGGEMLKDVVKPKEHQIREDFKERLSDAAVSQAPEFDDDDGFGGEIFGEMMRTCDNASCSGNISGENAGYYHDDATFTSPFSSLSSMDHSTLAAFLDEPDIDPAFAAIDCTIPIQPPSISSSTSISGDPNDLVADHAAVMDDILNCNPLAVPMSMPMPQFALEDERIVSLSSYMGLDAMHSSYVDPIGAGMGMFIPGSMGFAAASDVAFPTGLSMRHGVLASLPELGEYQSELNINVFPSESNGLQRAYCAADVKHLPGSCCESPARPTLEASSTDETSFKVGKLSKEERKLKINRYVKKRNERNFSKKIKYACRKTLADSRPRVRGRFAKNDDYGETGRSNQDDEDMVMKEDIIDSADIFAHFNSFKCNYTLESWI